MNIVTFTTTVETAINTFPKVFSMFGSVAADKASWARLLFVLRDSNDEDMIEKYAKALAVNAVPEEGDFHPRQATVFAVPGTATFQTPAGVYVMVSVINEDHDKVLVVIDFERNSLYAAREFLMGAYSQLGGHVLRDQLLISLAEQEDRPQVLRHCLINGEFVRGVSACSGEFTMDIELEDSIGLSGADLEDLDLISDPTTRDAHLS